MTVGVSTAAGVPDWSISSIARKMAAKTIKAMTTRVPMPIATRFSGDDVLSSEEKLSDEDTILPR